MAHVAEVPQQTEWTPVIDADDIGESDVLVLNIMSGEHYPMSRVLEWMGCQVVNYDYAISEAHDMRLANVRREIEEVAAKADGVLSGMCYTSFTRTSDIRRGDLPGGGPPKLWSEKHPAGLPEILSRHPNDSLFVCDSIRIAGATEIKGVIFTHIK